MMWCDMTWWCNTKNKNCCTIQPFNLLVIAFCFTLFQCANIACRHFLLVCQAQMMSKNCFFVTWWCADAQEQTASFDSKHSPIKKPSWLLLFTFDSILAYEYWIRAFCLGTPDVDNVKKSTLANLMNCMHQEHKLCI